MIIEFWTCFFFYTKYPFLYFFSILNSLVSRDEFELIMDSVCMWTVCGVVWGPFTPAAHGEAAGCFRLSGVPGLPQVQKLQTSSINNLFNQMIHLFHVDAFLFTDAWKLIQVNMLQPVSRAAAARRAALSMRWNPGESFEGTVERERLLLRKYSSALKSTRMKLLSAYRCFESFTKLSVRPGPHLCGRMPGSSGVWVSSFLLNLHLKVG